MLLSTAHFPPIQYFCKVIDQESFFIESKENYQKQSYRNRFNIFGANGPITLSVPIEKGRSPGYQIREAKIDKSIDWQKIHQKSIQSAYRHSPFYEFYYDDFKTYWEMPVKYLFDLNLNILMKVFEVLELSTDIRETDDFHKKYPHDFNDFRELIHPKVLWSEDTDFIPREYIQNFSDRHGFQANLSILDLIFQTGPDAKNIIRKSKRSIHQA